MKKKRNFEFRSFYLFFLITFLVLPVLFVLATNTPKVKVRFNFVYEVLPTNISQFLYIKELKLIGEEFRETDFYKEFKRLYFYYDLIKSEQIQKLLKINRWISENLNIDILDYFFYDIFGDELLIISQDRNIMLITRLDRISILAAKITTGLQKLKSSSQVSEELYKRVKISEITFNGRKYYLSLIGNYLLLSQNKDIIKQYIRILRDKKYSSKVVKITSAGLFNFVNAKEPFIYYNQGKKLVPQFIIHGEINNLKKINFIADTRDKKYIEFLPSKSYIIQDTPPLYARIDFINWKELYRNIKTTLEKDTIKNKKLNVFLDNMKAYNIKIDELLEKMGAPFYICVFDDVMNEGKVIFPKILSVIKINNEFYFRQNLNNIFRYFIKKEKQFVSEYYLNEHIYYSGYSLVRRYSDVDYIDYLYAPSLALNNGYILFALNPDEIRKEFEIDRYIDITQNLEKYNITPTIKSDDFFYLKWNFYLNVRKLKKLVMNYITTHKNNYPDSVLYNDIIFRFFPLVESFNLFDEVYLETYEENGYFKGIFFIN